MMYYVFFNNEKPGDLWDDNMLGDESFGKFYTCLLYTSPSPRDS